VAAVAVAKAVIAIVAADTVATAVFVQHYNCIKLPAAHQKEKP
jgi:hypothetical protein